MKLNKGIALSIIAVFILSFTVYAANLLTVTDIFSATKPTFGSDKQVASNIEHDDTSKHFIFAETSLNVNNPESFDVKITNITFVPNSGLSLKNTDITLVTAPAVISTSTSGAITVKALIPQDLDAVDSNLKGAAFKVGTLKVKYENAITPGGINESVPIDIYMQRANQLSIKDLDAVISDKDTQNNINDGDEIKDLRPGDKIDLTAKIENNFNSKDNLDIEGIQMDISCNDESDIDFNDDSIDFGDLGPNDDDTDTLSLEIADDAKDDTLSCLLTVEGTDQNGAKHGDSIDFDLKIDRKTHDIVIDSVIVNPTALTCSDNTMQLSVDITNLGTRDEDQVAIQVQSLTLGLNEKVANLQLNEDDSSTETIALNVDPTSIASGQYALLVTTFYDNTKQTDSKVVQISNLCEAADVGNDNTNVVDNSGNDFMGDEFTDAITLDDTEISTSAGKLVSLKVQTKNNENVPVDYTVSLDNLNEFATPTSSKNVHLSPGQTATVFLNIKVKDDVESGASYTANVVVKETTTGNVLETETFTVQIAESTSQPIFGNLNFGGNSKVLLTIGNIVLVIIAIFLIKLIFTSGRKKKPTERKLADYEPKGGSVVMKKR